MATLEVQLYPGEVQPVLLTSVLYHLRYQR